MKKLFDFLKKYSLVILILSVFALGTIYYFYWHLQPFTQNAFLFANTQKVTPLVAGYIDEIYVKNNQFVKKGAPLFRTFQQPYILKCRQIEKEIRKIEMERESLMAKKDAETFLFASRTAQWKNEYFLLKTAEHMYASLSVSMTYYEERKRSCESAEALCRSTEQTIRALSMEIESTLAETGRLHDAMSLAKIEESQTIVTAQQDGYITNMSILPGGYYTPGTTLFAIVGARPWYVQANFKESELSGLRPGLKAKVWLWQYPGRVLYGKVTGKIFSAERRKEAVSGLPEVLKENEWFLLPQRFPVQIELINPPDDLALHFGASAFVELETESHPIRQFFWQLFLR